MKTLYPVPPDLSTDPWTSILMTIPFAICPPPTHGVCASFSLGTPPDHCYCTVQSPATKHRMWLSRRFPPHPCPQRPCGSDGVHTPQVKRPNLARPLCTGYAGPSVWPPVLPPVKGAALQAYEPETPCVPARDTLCSGHAGPGMPRYRRKHGTYTPF